MCLFFCSNNVPCTHWLNNNAGASHWPVGKTIGTVADWLKDEIYSCDISEILGTI